MPMKRILSADAGLSVLFHVLKAAVALFVNWLVLRHFAMADFVTWSVTSSVLMVATASDLGIGQYIVTRMINAPRQEWPAEIARGLTALLPLALLSALFVLFALDGPSPLYLATMAVLLAGRIVTIPFVAVLHAMNQFKVRKAMELAAYVIAAVLVGAVAATGADIHLALVGLNATFLMGAAMMVAAASRYVSVRGALRFAPRAQAAMVFRGAVPFMANNLTGLLAYGGFIWLSSLVLPEADVARLAVLHTFVLVNLYQLYDVFLKARQADLVQPERLPPYRALNLAIMAALPLGFFLLGAQGVALIDARVMIGPLQAALFGLFMALELGNLFAQSVTQVNVALVARLKTYAALRAAMLLGFAGAGLLPIADEMRLAALLALLCAGSAMALVYLMRRLSGAPRRSLGQQSSKEA